MAEKTFEKQYDVVVVGGGIAGIAAAVQSARAGMKTAIIEKTILPGGLATSGLVYIYLPLCDGNMRQVSFGITEELMMISKKYGPGYIPETWNTRPGNDRDAERLTVRFSPAAYMLALDEILEDSGVDIWYDTLFTDVEMSGSKVTAVICENKSGRIRIKAKSFVDASGDADVMRRAGVPCNSETNYLSIWAIEYNSHSKGGDFGDYVTPFMDGVPWDASQAPDGTMFRGLDGKVMSQYVLKSRRLLRDHYKKLYSEGRKCNEAYALKVPAMAQFRKTYSINAEYVLDSNQNNMHFDDSVGLVSDWRKAGPVWEIPYRTLYSANHTGGILTAGRSIGSINDAWEVTRVIPVAGLTGQAAGLAAAMCAKTGREPWELAPADLQKELVASGLKLHLEDVGLAPETK